MSLGASKHCWLIHNNLFVMRNCQSSPAMPPRVQDTGQQEWGVWPKETRRPSLTWGPHVLSHTQHLIRLAITGNPVWKTVFWFGWGRNQKESLHPQHQCLISTSVYHDRHLGGFLYSPTHSRKHSLNISWEKCVGWGITNGDRATMSPYSRKLRKILWKRLFPLTSYYFKCGPQTSSIKHHLEVCWKCQISGPSSRLPESESAR